MKCILLLTKVILFSGFRKIFIKKWALSTMIRKSGSLPLALAIIPGQSGRYVRLSGKKRFRLFTAIRLPPSGGLVARLAAIGMKVYVIYTAHGFHFYQGAGRIHNFIYHTVENFLSRKTDVIVTINHEDYQAAEKMHEKKGA